MRDLTQNVGNVLTIQHQTCVDEIFKCTIFVGYGGVIFFTGVPPLENDCVKVFAFESNCLYRFSGNSEIRFGFARMYCQFHILAYCSPRI